MDEVQPQREERGPTPAPSFGKLLMSAPIEPGDLPERDSSSFREMFADLPKGDGDEIIE